MTVQKFLLLSNADIAFWDWNEDKKYGGSRPTRAEMDDDWPLRIHALKCRYIYLWLYRDCMGNTAKTAHLQLVGPAGVKRENRGGAKL